MFLSKSVFLTCAQERLKQIWGVQFVVRGGELVFLGYVPLRLPGGESITSIYVAFKGKHNPGLRVMLITLPQSGALGFWTVLVY